MGMHFGMLAVSCPWAVLLPQLQAYVGEFREVDETEFDEDASDEGDALESDDDLDFGQIEVDEYHGSTCITDPTFKLSGGEPDLIVTLSKFIPGPVVAYYAETASGSFGLVVAEQGRLLRLYQACHAAYTQVLSIGEPLPFEATANLEALDGAGAIAALGHFGFVDTERSDFSQIKIYDFRPRPDSAVGPLRRLITEHESKYAIPPGHDPSPRVVARIVPRSPDDADQA